MLWIIIALIFFLGCAVGYEFGKITHSLYIYAGEIEDYEDATE